MGEQKADDNNFTYDFTSPVASFLEESLVMLIILKINPQSRC